MPTSNPYQLNEIIELIILSNPKSILDIGVGFGKYGVLSREYLELYVKPSDYSEWNRHIDGIEAFRGYLTPLHDFVYDNIYFGNAIEILPTLKSKYNLILIIDLLEHFEFDEGVALLEKCEQQAKNLIISTPLNIGIQEDVFGNPYETHRSQWRKRDFDRFKDKCFIYSTHFLICYVGDGALHLEHSRRSRVRLGIRLLFPFISKLYGLLRTNKNDIKQKR